MIDLQHQSPAGPRRPHAPPAAQPRRLVICCDGTSNEVAGNQTNVLRLFRCLRHTDEQVTFYDPGVGTLADPMALTRFRKLVQRKLDSAIGRSICQNFSDAYGFLVRNYRRGDSVYLFGFSRGAYTARAVAGALHMCGLLRPELQHLVPYVWAMYSNDGEAHDVRARFGGAARFKQIMAVDDPQPAVALMGLWDTVSSYGWFWDFQALPHTANNPSVRQVRHALALHERRVAFAANLFRDDKGEPANSASVRQIWFPGVHADLGGGYPEGESGLAKVALEWMIDEARLCGLTFDEDAVARHLGAQPAGGGGGRRVYTPPSATAERHESLAGWWRVLEALPRRVWTATNPEDAADQQAGGAAANGAGKEGGGDDRNGSRLRRRGRGVVLTKRWSAPHRGRRRWLPPNAWFHPSVLEWAQKHGPDSVPGLPRQPEVVVRDSQLGWISAKLIGSRGSTVR